MNHVDTSSPITHISLCAGYGGIDLGLARAIPNLRTIAFSEIEAFACANLVSKMEAGLLDCAPIWTDLKTFPWDEFRDRVDILSGGYPCQPFSAAGKRLGKDDPRHLWPFIADGIAAMRPRVVFFENVEGHISMGLSDVMQDLGRMGYRSTWGIFSASEVGAPHQRKRVFIMAHLINERPQGWLRGGAHEERENLNGHSGCSGSSAYGGWPSRPGQPQHEWEPPRVVSSASAVVGNAESKQGSSRDNGRQPRLPCQQKQGKSGGGDCGALRTGNRRIKSTVGRNFDEPSRGMGYAELSVSCDNRTDELRLLGNGVVPATAELAFRTLLTELTTNKNNEQSKAGA
jgi:DNA (cytosine-5)-methyltransferase 1